MKNGRNSSVLTLFWAILVLLLILGLITQIIGLAPITFPEEDSHSPTSSNIPVVETNSSNTSDAETITNTVETTPSIPESESENLDSNPTTEDSDATIETESNVTDESMTIPETEPTVENTDESIIEPPTQESVPTEPVGTIYLTFDDGPSLSITPQILDILKSNNISATFFIIDYEYGSQREELVKRAFNEGHTIALHGTSHTYSEIYTSLEALVNNFETLQEKVFTSTGYRSYIIRFPGGSSNTVSKKYCPGIMTEAVEYFAATDFVYFDWNVDSADAGGAYSMEDIYENVTSGIKKGRNNVILMHDSGNKKYTVEALQSIIDWALAEGYEFKAITQETPQVTHRIAN